MSTKNTVGGFERGEVIGITVSILVAILFFVILRYDLSDTMFKNSETGQVVDTRDTVTIDQSNSKDELFRSLMGAITNKGEIQKLITEDTTVGTGTAVMNGSRITVHYTGMLQNGTTFDSSYPRGEPYSFTVGGGTVIKGWDTGLIGMKEGGERILVIPPDLAYGNRQVGTIPPNSALLFSIELLKVE